MNNVDSAYSRPNFFPGQLVDYRDFNRLSQFPQTVLQDFLKGIFPGGGILLGAKDQFRPVAVQGMTLAIQPGLAVLPTGELASLDQLTVLDLEKVVRTGDTVFVTIGNDRMARDKFTDPEDTTITGFLSEGTVTRVEASTVLPSADRLELLRIDISSATKRISASSSESASEEVAVIDLSYRKLLLAQTAPDFSELEAARTQLALLDESLRKLGKLFLMEDAVSSTMHLLSSVHAELLSLPPQPLKMGFLLSEFARKLALFLENLDRHLPLNRNDLDRPRVMQTLGLIDPLRRTEPFVQKFPVNQVSDVASSLNLIVRFAEERFSLFTLVEEALLTLRDQPLRMDAELPFAGQMFRKIDSIDSQNASKLRFQSKEIQNRRMQAKYGNGASHEALGAFFRTGGVDIEFEVAKTDRPAVILIRHHVRRSQAIVHYDINGKTLAADAWEKLGLANQWMNRGLVIPSDRLVPGLNRLSLRVENCDLDFGFFDLHVYQPGDLGGKV